MAGAVAGAVAVKMGIARLQSGNTDLFLRADSRGPSATKREATEGVEVRGQLRWGGLSCLAVTTGELGSYVGVAACNDHSPHTQFLFTPGPVGTLIRVAAIPSTCIAVESGRAGAMVARRLAHAVPEGQSLLHTVAQRVAAAVRQEEERPHKPTREAAGAHHLRQVARPRPTVTATRTHTSTTATRTFTSTSTSSSSTSTSTSTSSSTSTSTSTTIPKRQDGRYLVVEPCEANERTLWVVPDSAGPVHLAVDTGTCMRGPPWHGPVTTFRCHDLGPETHFEVLPTESIRATPSLLCILVMRKEGIDRDLVTAMLDKGIEVQQDIGIFGCNAFKVFCIEQLTVGWHRSVGWVQTSVFQEAPVDQTVNYGHAANVQLFLNMWYALRDTGEHTRNDWTIKADDDAVIFPTRLRQALRPHTAEGANIFFNNCWVDHTNPKWPMMYGALEVMSRGAMVAFFGNANQWCHDPWNWGTLGEDEYLTRCLAWSGSTAVLDEWIVADAYCAKSIDCQQDNPAFHPFKVVGDWLGCWFTAMNTSSGAPTSSADEAKMFVMQ